MIFGVLRAEFGIACRRLVCRRNRDCGACCRRYHHWSSESAHVEATTQLLLPRPYDPEGPNFTFRQTDVGTASKDVLSEIRPSVGSQRRPVRCIQGPRNLVTNSCVGSRVSRSCIPSDESGCDPRDSKRDPSSNVITFAAVEVHCTFSSSSPPVTGGGGASPVVSPKQFRSIRSRSSCCPNCRGRP